MLEQKYHYGCRSLVLVLTIIALSGCANLNTMIATGEYDGVLEYIKKGKTIDLQDDLGRGPLHHAVIAGEERIFSSLLASGAEVNLSDADGDSPLHMAIRRGHHDMATALVKHGADLSMCNDADDSPMSLVTRTGDVQLTEQMIRVGADFSIPCAGATTVPGEIAVEQRQNSVVDLLLIEGQLRPPGRDPAYVAERIVFIMHTGSADVASQDRIRQHLGTQVNVLDDSGTTPLLMYVSRS